MPADPINLASYPCSAFGPKPACQLLRLKREVRRAVLSAFDADPEKAHSSTDCTALRWELEHLKPSGNRIAICSLSGEILGYVESTRRRLSSLWINSATFSRHDVHAIWRYTAEVLTFRASQPRGSFGCVWLRTAHPLLGSMLNSLGFVSHPFPDSNTYAGVPHSSCYLWYKHGNTHSDDIPYTFDFIDNRHSPSRRRHRQVIYGVLSQASRSSDDASLVLRSPLAYVAEAAGHRRALPDRIDVYAQGSYKGSLAGEHLAACMRLQKTMAADNADHPFGIAPAYFTDCIHWPLPRLFQWSDTLPITNSPPE